MGDNLKIRMLRADLAGVLNKSLLPAEVKRMILKELLEEMTRKTEELVRQEQMELQKEIEEREKQNEESRNNPSTTENTELP